MTLVPLGQDLVNGEPAIGCEHMAAWWPLFSRMGRALGLVRECFDIVQAQGASSKSADTHLQGTCVDVTQDAPEVAALARECGAPGSWGRGPRYNQTGFDAHSHLGLDCPCWSNADYQIAAVKAGYDGLGVNGRGGKDYIAVPDVWRDWESGIAHMEQRLVILEDDMFSDSDRAMLREVSTRLRGTDPRVDSLVLLGMGIKSANEQLTAVALAVKALDGLDASAIAAAIPDDLAEQVVAALGERLAPKA